ncbi:hypothetical protein MJO29_015611 [Puccinia striiformis f. sp. tritici]|nr:hypothetical protein MJO29_015611 [Puccinia striiformis f. sp. tritici]
MDHSLSRMKQLVKRRCRQEEDEQALAIIAISLGGGPTHIQTLRTYLTQSDLTGHPRFNQAWDNTTIPTSNVNSHGAPWLHKQSLNAAGGLGLLLHWLSSTMAGHSLNQIFAIAPAVIISSLSSFSSFSSNPHFFLTLMKYYPVSAPFSPSIIRTGFPAGPRVRFRPEPPPRPTLTLLDYSPEVDHPLSIDHPLENEYYPSSRLAIGDRSLGYISPPPTSSSELLPSIVILTYSISTFLITLLNDRSSGQTSSPHDPRRKSESNQPLSYPKSSRTSWPIEKPNLTTEYSSTNLFATIDQIKECKQSLAETCFLSLWSTNELIKDPRPTVHSKDFDAVTFKKRFEALEKALNNDRLNSPQEKKNAAVFNARFEEYKAALIQAQEVEVQATQKGDKTIIPTSKILKLETRREPLDLTIPPVTGNVHLDKHLAQTPITEKPVDKKNKATKKKILPLDSSIGDLSISSFTTEPFFEDLEPTLKRITPKRALPAISDSESEAGISIDHPSSPILERIASKPELSILSDSEDELDEGPIIPTLNPSTLIQNDEPSKLDEPIKVLKTPKGTTKHPGSLGIIREPLLSDESRASSEMESESEDEIPEAEIIRILIKKQVKIHARYLKATSNDDKKLILDQAQQNQLVLQKLIPNKEIESYVNGWNPWVEKKKVFPAPPKNKKRPKSDKRNQPRQSGSNRPDQTHSNYNRDQTRSTNSRNRTHSNMSRGQGRSNNNSRQTHSNQNNKRYREESEDLEDPARWKEVHRATAVLGAFFRHTKR